MSRRCDKVLGGWGGWPTRREHRGGIVRTRVTRAGSSGSEGGDVVTPEAEGKIKPRNVRDRNVSKKSYDTLLSRARPHIATRA